MDRLATLAINASGAAVIGLILLILGYLIYVAWPLGQEAVVAEPKVAAVPAQGALVVADEASALWRIPRPLASTNRPETTPLVLVQDGYVLVITDGVAFVYHLDTARAQSNAASALPVPMLLKRVSLPSYEDGEIAFHHNDARFLVAYHDTQDDLHAVQFSEEGDVTRLKIKLSAANLKPAHLKIFADARQGLVIATSGTRFLRWSLPRSDIQINAHVNVGTFALPPLLARSPRVMAWGPGRESMLLASAGGAIARLDPSRADMRLLGDVIHVDGDISSIVSEARRQVSLVRTASGQLYVINPTTGETLYRSPAEMRFPADLSVSSDGTTLYQLERSTGAIVITRWSLDNAFPETTLRGLWTKNHYGGYDTAGNIWHPDGESIGVLSKYGLTPLLFGTFKAALCGLILAIPLAIGAAIYTGYFLAPRRRDQIKPAIELLEAFPTVVLGFIAGLWLAPLLLDYLILVFVLPLVLIGVPLVLAFAHSALQRLSVRFLARPPRVALILACYLLSFALLVFYAQPLELQLLGGPAQDWLWDSFGLRYDQRNALLVGIAMGIAIMPTMFSLIEDAIFAVPRGLSDGSLALGATRWQSLSKVVLPAASPALLSGVVIGFARGLGETMIVLLAAGNTPMIQGDVFSGLRSLSASIAAELPEAGVVSVQFKVLFLAALVLFALTFVLNTLAELLRQRLRYAYANH